MTADEELSAAVAEAQATLRDFPPDDIPSRGAFSAVLENLRAVFTASSVTSGISAGVMAKNLAAGMKVIIEAQGLTGTSNEKISFAKALLVIQGAYMDARNKALVDSASKYVITATLRSQAAALTSAYNKVKADAAAMTKVADALGGVTALIKAIS